MKKIFYSETYMLFLEFNPSGHLRGILQHNNTQKKYGLVGINLQEDISTKISLIAHNDAEEPVIAFSGEIQLNDSNELMKLTSLTISDEWGSESPYQEVKELVFTSKGEYSLLQTSQLNEIFLCLDPINN